MRLNKYIHEQYRYSRPAQEQKNKVTRLIKKKLDELKNDLGWCNFDVTLTKLCMILTAVYIKDGIRFIEDGPNQIESYRYVKGFDFYKNGDVEIFLSQETPQHIKELYEENRLKDMNDKFYKELIWALTHGRMYANRVKRLKDMFNFVGYNPIKKHLCDYKNHYAYIASQEIEEDDFSPTRSLVHDLIGRLPEYKEFLELFNKHRNGELDRPSSVGLLDW